jgi:hypothetical protein
MRAALRVLAIPGNVGNQQYEVSVDVNLDRYSTVAIWCRAFSVLFARAPLEGGEG